MFEAYSFIAIAVILLALLPIVPKMVCLRIRVLNFLHWNRLAGWHERHMAGIVMAVRVIFCILAAYLIYLSFISM